MARTSKGKYRRRSREEKEFQQRVIDLARVTRVMAGGKRMRFRACVAIGDGKGRCGIGIAKGADVTLAINKAVSRAKKDVITIPLINDTIPHRIYMKHGAAKILLKPAPQGTGVKAGGALRIVLELAGVGNISAKILGTNNKINNVQGLIEALKSFKYDPKQVQKTGTKERKGKTEKKSPAKKKATPKKDTKDDKKPKKSSKKTEKVTKETK